MKAEPMARNSSPQQPRVAPVGQTPPSSATHNHGFWAGRWVSFRAATTGVIYILRTQPNAWIELVAIAVVIAASLWFDISRAEWAVIGLTCGLVLALEAVNTAVEAAVDLISPDHHPLAGIAKDAAAGAMVFVVVGSLCVAGFIFGPRLWQWFFP